MTILFIYILSFLYSSDTIRHPEKLPIKNHVVVEHLKKKEQPKFLNDEYWDDDRILFSTYFGGSGYDCINDGAFDSHGNFIQVGYTGSPDLPIVGDAFQKEKNLNHDMFIVKWNPYGDVIWSTFLGGSGADVLYSVAIDKNDDIIVAGRTESTDIIVSDDASQKVNIGGSDFYLAKFTTDGEYVWSTFLGGSLNEFQSKIVLDDNGFIYLGGGTESTGKNDKPNKMLPVNDNSLMSFLNKFNNDGQYVTTYICKFTPNGKFIWGTYFGNEGEVSEILTGIDVYKGEIAFSWDLSKVVEFDGKQYYVIVTEDAEQKEGVIKEGDWESEGWQAQVFKIDTAGTTLKYGTFYCGDYSSGKKIMYDKKGNLYCLIGTDRLKSRKDSLFSFSEKNGVISFVKYNRNNVLEWDFSYSCEKESGSIYDFDIDENNVLWTAGSTSCNELEQSTNPFPSITGPGVGVSGFIFVLNLDNYKYWASYNDIGISNKFSINCIANQLYVSGCKTVGKTKNAYQPESKNKDNHSGAFYKLNMENVFNYEDTSGLDTIDDNSIIIYPNPANEIININSENLLIIELFDIFGNKLLEDYNTKLDIKHLSPGTYYIRYLGQTRMVVKL